MPNMNRREFVRASAIFAGAAGAGLTLPNRAEASTTVTSHPLVDIDYETLVSRSDLWYVTPAPGGTATHPDAGCDYGQPIGNGRMGSMVWTTPDSVEFQINRVDVFANNHSHQGIFGSQGVFGDYTPDYCGVCATVSVHVGGTAFQGSEHFQQHLSLYNAESSASGDWVTVRCFVSAAADVLVVEVDDNRPANASEPVRVRLAMWSLPEEHLGDRVESYEFSESGARHSVVRTWAERDDYYCRSAVSVQAAGGARLRLEASHEQEQTYVVEGAKRGKTLLLISSAASMDRRTNVLAQSTKVLDRSWRLSYADLRASHQAWWKAFWSRSFVSLSSADGSAEFIERLRAIHLYLMASTSRGDLPPKWNSMLFVTGGDDRMFGGQYWGWTMESLYIPLFAADASDLADPYFDMYVRQLPGNRIVARQRWGAKGAYYPEVAAFDGPAVLPESVADEFRNVLLDQPRSGPFSDEAKALGNYDATFINVLNGEGPFTQISHIWTTGPKIALHAWWRYRYTGDVGWLRSHAYPLLRDTSEFYRSMAVKKGDGRYHLEFSNVHESCTGVANSLTDMGAIRGVIPLAIRAAETLGVDPGLRLQWRRFLDQLAPMPMGRDPESQTLGGAVLADDVWALGHSGPKSGGDGRGDEDLFLFPVFPFENYTLETRDTETIRIAQKIVDIMPGSRSLLDGVPAFGRQTTPRTAVAIARAGRGEALPNVLQAWYRSFTEFPNGFSPFEAGALSIEHLGILVTALQDGLLQSISASPGEPEVIRIRPAWPHDWDATFRLVARGSFVVTAAVKGGAVGFVEITSREGGVCRFRNPWGAPFNLVEVDKRGSKRVSGDLINIETTKGKTYQLYLDDRPSVVPVPGPPPNPGQITQLGVQSGADALVETLESPVVVTATASRAGTGVVELHVPAGWSVQPTEAILQFPDPWERTQTAQFMVTPPAGSAGDATLRVIASTAGSPSTTVDVPATVSPPGVLTDVGVASGADALVEGLGSAVVVQATASSATGGSVELKVPSGWTVTPASVDLAFPDANQLTQFVSFTVTPPLGSAGDASLQIVAEAGGHPPTTVDVPARVSPPGVLTDVITSANLLAQGAPSTVAVRATASSPTSGTVQLKVPSGWTVTPDSIDLAFPAGALTQTASFTVTAPAGSAGNTTLQMVAQAGGHPPTTTDVAAIVHKTVVDDHDSSIVYAPAINPDQWRQEIHDYATGSYEDTWSISRTPDNSATYTFTGTSVTWIGNTQSNFGMADVYLDGALVAHNIDLYSNDAIFQQALYKATGLTNTEHVLKLVVTGNQNPLANDIWIAVDAFTVD
jgi:hypothetical protein